MEIAFYGKGPDPYPWVYCRKEEERESHTPKEYNSVTVISNGVDCNVRFHESNDPEAWVDDDGKHFPNRTSNTERATQVNDLLNDHRQLKLQDIRESQVKRKPQPPFTTDTMLQNSSSILGWSIGKTSTVASSLYQSGHITYIRTDSTRTNENARTPDAGLCQKQIRREISWWRCR